MRRWFLSYHSADQALAERLKAAIERKDSASHVFFAPTHMRAGGSWSGQLAQEIADATAFILLIGERVGPWQVLEYDEALDKWAKSPSDFPLIVILLEGQTAPGLPFLRRLHWIIAPDPSSERDIARLFDAASGGGTNRGDLWRYTSPYRGLEAMEEKDSDYFFGRKRETVDVLSALAAAPDRLPVLIGNSGVGKSSLAQAGVLAALKRQAWPEEGGAPNAWPQVFEDSRRWCFLTLKPGTEPLKSLIGAFLDTWQFGATDPERVKQQNGWIELLRDGKATLRDLLDATERRHNELDQSKAPAFFLYVDQGEELYVRAEERERQRFSEIVAHALPDPRLRAMMSMRSDFLGGLQNDEPLFNVHRQINVPPLREAELRKVVSRPAELLSARFETPGLVDIITRHTAEDSVKDVGALPLLSYTLDDMWTQMAKGGEGVLRLPAQSFELGGVLVDRADKFLATHPGAEDALRRVLTLRLADVHEEGEPTRRPALRSEFNDEEWRLVSELADHPNRLLVTVTPKSGETYAEVAHEAIFRRWDKLREWIAAEREFLAWRSGLEAARRAWQATPDASKADALLMGAALSQAQSWLLKRAQDLPAPDRDFIALSIAREKRAQGRARRIRALVYVLLVGMIVGLVGWIEQSYIKGQWTWYATDRPFMKANMWPYVLTPAAEQVLKPDPNQSFRECAPKQPDKDYCPDMVVVPAGSFLMGSPPSDNQPTEQPQHPVTIAKPFAVSKYELTFDEWDTCVNYGDCPQGVSDGDFGRGQQPVINVTWDDAQHYVAWLSKTTGKTYRLLSEAEYEYATRAVTTTAATMTEYPWGNDIKLNGTVMANCAGCGSKWDNSQTAPVGSFAPNKFGLHDMVGNVWEWAEDCVLGDYNDAPADGSAWIEGGNCKGRTVRGGSWDTSPDNLRSALRGWYTTDVRYISLGFRLGRTLLTP
jgi:formylglycine-generating enzyme required for sulfatase activity